VPLLSGFLRLFCRNSRCIPSLKSHSPQVPRCFLRGPEVILLRTRHDLFGFCSGSLPAHDIWIPPRRQCDSHRLVVSLSSLDGKLSLFPLSTLQRQNSDSFFFPPFLISLGLFSLRIGCYTSCFGGDAISFPARPRKPQRPGFRDTPTCI